MTPTISAVSFAYPEVPAGDRAELVTRLGARTERPVKRVFVLSTCLRLEIAVHGDRRELSEVTAALLGREPEAGWLRVDRDAVHHLVRVASGLESPVVGELEVWTQFRRALAEAKQAGLDGGLVKVLEQVVAAGKLPRELLPASPEGSLASVVAAALGEVDRVAVLGGGQMAHAAASVLLAERRPVGVTIVARSPARVNVPGAVVWPFDRAGEALSTFPAVVSATSAKRRLVGDDELVRILEQRQEPLTLVDLAMPPDHRPPPGARVRYVAIDELAAMVTERVDTTAADELAVEVADRIWRRFEGHQHVAPVIGRIYADADDLVARTVARFAGRLADPSDVGVMRQALQTVARTLLAGPVDHMHRSEEPLGTARTMAAAFGVDRDPDDG